MFPLSSAEDEEEPVKAKRINNKRPHVRATKKGGKKAAMKKEEVIEEK